MLVFPLLFFSSSPKPLEEGKGTTGSFSSFSKASTASCCQQRAQEDEILGCPSGTHHQLLPTQRDALGNCHHLTWGVLCIFFPSRKCLPLSYHPLCRGVRPCSRILAKVSSPLHLPVRRGSNEARLVCHVRSSMHVVMEVIPINFYPEVCIVNLSSNKIRTST